MWGRVQLTEQINRVTTAICGEPWNWDQLATTCYNSKHWNTKLKLAHLYAGTFGGLVEALQYNGCRVCYTAAAHDIDLSRREHERLGVPYHYPHLTDPALLQRYLAGYLAADCVVCPSTHSAAVMRKLGRTGRIEVIPHGVNLPSTVQPLPRQFRVGYLGSCGSPDKGLIYLLQAWKQLNYPDAILVLGGRDSQSPWVQHLIQEYGGGTVVCLGWVRNLADFYGNISMLVQPSVSEGFGIEVLEALAHGRYALVSKGAGAADVVPIACRFEAANYEVLAAAIDHARKHWDWGASVPASSRELANDYTWNKIREQYISLWKELL